MGSGVRPNFSIMLSGFSFRTGKVSYLKLSVRDVNKLQNKNLNGCAAKQSSCVPLYLIALSRYSSIK